MMNGTHRPANIYSLQKLTRFSVVQHLWGTPFKGKQYELVGHREKINSKISKLPLPLRLKFSIKQDIILLEQAYNQMSQWIEIYHDLEPLNLLDSNERYFAPSYFTVEGHFNDIAWVKQFIFDPEECIVKRFYFACCYCLEGEIPVLWQQMKECGEVSSNGDLSDFRYALLPLVALWIYKLENKLDEYIVDCGFAASSFWYVGLVESVLHGHEEATYYFWNHLSHPEKDDLIQSDMLYRISLRAAESRYSKVVYFLYSQLHHKQKYDLLHFTTHENELPEVWCCLLESPFTHSSVLQEILDFPYFVPVEIYANLLCYLAFSLEKFKLLMFKNAFLALWQKVSEVDQLHLLRKKPFILRHLINAKELDVASLIMKRIPPEEKPKYLFMNGLENFVSLIAQGEYELLERYLSFLMIHFDKILHDEVIREDASSILKMFVQSPIISAWIQGLPEKEKTEVNKVFDALQTSRATISNLLDQIEKNTIRFSLSFGENINKL